MKTIHTRKSLRRPVRPLAALLAAATPLLGVAAATTLTLTAPCPAVAAAQDNKPESAATSRLLNIALPAGAVHPSDAQSLADMTGQLKNITDQAGFTLGRVEVLVWGGKEHSAARGQRIKDTLTAALKKGGLTYEKAGEKNTDDGLVTIFLAGKPNAKSATLGFFVAADSYLVLSWGEITPKDKAAAPATTEATTPAPAAAPAAPAANNAPGDAVTVNVDAKAFTVNVMKNAMPALPVFPKLAPKPGMVRGYVYDTNGKPLKGARLGVRATSAGGFYSGAQGTTDAKGYYEIAVPWGAAHFYGAGYAVEYGEGRAGLGLHPADGEAESFASPNGQVENFVLLPYGVGDRDDAQDNPRYCNNYYGGDIVLSWHLDDDERFPTPGNLPVNAQIEITLTPDGPLVDGSRGRTIVLRKAVGTLSFGQLYVNNIPVGSYKISAKLVGGGALKMKEAGPTSGQPFGLEPKEATGSAALLLRPSSAKADGIPAGHGNWEQIGIVLERP